MAQPATENEATEGEGLRLVRTWLWVRRESITLLTIGVLGCVSVVGAVAASRIADLDGKITSALHREDLAMQTLTEEVTRSNGSKVTVSTVRLDNETVADWIARHDEAVAAVSGD